MNQASITLSERAARRISEILGGEENGALFRVSVEGGGCSGFQYRFDVTRDQAADDLLVERGNARVLIDPISLGFLQGSEIDFVE
jgi:iron-sulfur cluster assembly accessory protein